MTPANSLLLAANYFYKLSKIDNYNFSANDLSINESEINESEIEIPLKESDIILKSPGEVSNMILNYIKNKMSKSEIPSASDNVIRKIKKDSILAISEYCIGKIEHGAKDFMPFSKSIEKDSSSQESKMKYKRGMMKRAEDIYNMYVAPEVKNIPSKQKSSYIDYIVKILLSTGEGIL